MMTSRNTTPVLDRLIELPGVFTEGPVDRFGHRSYTEGPKRPTWANRRDLQARDTLQISDTVVTNVQVRIYTIRYDTGVEVGDSITDDESKQRKVIGMAETPWGRDRFLALTCEYIR